MHVWLDLIFISSMPASKEANSARWLGVMFPPIPNSASCWSTISNSWPDFGVVTGVGSLTTEVGLGRGPSTGALSGLSSFMYPSSSSPCSPTESSSRSHSCSWSFHNLRYSPIFSNNRRTLGSWQGDPRSWRNGRVSVRYGEVLHPLVSQSLFF